MRSLLARALAIAIILPPSPAWAKAADNDTLPVNIGINVGGVNDYAVESFFVNAMMQSRHWGSPSTPWDEAAQVDALGWPTQDAGVVVLCCLADARGNTELSGTYALSFTGIATVGFVAYPGTVSNMVYNAATNTSTASLTLPDSGAGTSLMLSFTNTQRTATSPVGSGVTNVSIIRPQLAPNGKPWWTSAGQVFTSPFLALLKPYSTLRFMDFTATNSVNLTSWSQRTTPQDATQQSSNGAAWEYAILLANTLHKDIWINIPDQADADYVTQLATLLHSTLDPKLHIWIEYSNEVWNWEFPQATRNQDAAVADVKADRKSPLALHCHDFTNCQYVWGARLIGLKALQMGQAFYSVYGAKNPILRPVYATQMGQTYYVSLVLGMIKEAFGEPSDYLYALAQAPYWSGDNTIDGLTKAQELANAAANLATLPVPERAFAAWATDWGLKSVTYEGGPGMSGTPSLEAKIKANTSPDMGTLVSQSLRMAVSNDASLYMYYNDAGAYGQYGMWGLTQDVFDRGTPKQKGLAAVMEDGTETLAVGSAVPATIAAGYPDLCTGSEYIVTGNSYAYFNQGGSCTYLVNVPATGQYSVVLSAGTYGAATTGTLLDNRRAISSIAVPYTNGNVLDWTNTTPVTVPLTAGLHMLSVKAPQAAFGMQSLSVVAAQ
jgi:hypothetical protein